MKIDLVLEELHRSENDLALRLLHVAERHKVDHDVYHLGGDLAGWSQRHVRELAEVGRDFGLDLDPEPKHESELTRTLREQEAEWRGRQSEPALMLLFDLRELYALASRVGVDWEMLGQVAQAAKNRELLDFTKRCHPETVQQLGWVNAKLKESAPQILVS